jgi:hypothetical protein
LNGKTHSSAPPPRPLYDSLNPSDTDASELSAPTSTKTELNPTTVGPTTVEVRRGALGLRESGITLRPPSAQREQPSSNWPTPEIASIKTPVGLSSSARPQISSHVVWAAALVGVAGLTALYFGAQPKNTSTQPPAKIRVVSSTTSGEPTPKVEALPAAPRPAVAPLRSDAASRARSGAGEAHTAPRGESMEQGSPEARRLTRAFGKQQSRIEACFVQHAVDPGSLPPLQFEFVLEAEGKLSSAQVAPQAVANTPLGKCLTAVASQTEFPAQGKPLTFSIPLLTTRAAPTPR